MVAVVTLLKRKATKEEKKKNKGRGQGELVPCNTEFWGTYSSIVAAGKEQLSKTMLTHIIIFGFCFLFCVLFLFLKIQFHYIAHIGFELMVFLTQSPQC